MAFDLVIKNGRIVDGSGMPGYGGDVAIKGAESVGRDNQPTIVAQVVIITHLAAIKCSLIRKRKKSHIPKIRML